MTFNYPPDSKHSKHSKSYCSPYVKKSLNIYPRRITWCRHKYYDCTMGSTASFEEIVLLPEATLIKENKTLYVNSGNM